MKVNWIVEKYMFEDYQDVLVDIISRQHNCLLVDDTSIDFDFEKDIKSQFSEDDCVIFYGSLQRGRQIWRDTNFIPGIFLTIDNYEYYKYYGYYGDELVNSNYVLMGLNDVKRNKFGLFNSEDYMFIRPSNGYKTFTGQLLPFENFEREFDILCKSYGGVDMNQLVLIAPKQDVREENRFIIINENGENKVVDGTMYMVDNIETNERIIDIKARNYVEQIVNNYTPDKAFTIDIARMGDGSYKVLEIGSFCCAGWYKMDLDRVVYHINQLCINEYNEYYKY